MAPKPKQKFNVLQQSPYDCQDVGDPEPTAAPDTPEKWIPSYYTVRSTADDGSLILWNTLSGTISTFKLEQSADVKALLRRKGVEAKREGLIEYLSDRGFIVKEGAQEYRKFQLAFGAQHYRPDVLELTLLASEDCNFRCQYCYEDFSRGTMKPWVRQSVKKFVKKRIENGVNYLVIGWFGGEPLYGYSAIEDLAPFFHQICQDNDVYLRGHITTNGYLLTPDKASNLLRWGVRRYQITIDGLPGDHDRNRPTREGGETFRTVFGNIQHMATRVEDFILEVRINYDRQSYPNMVNLLDLLGEHLGGDPRFRVRLRPVGRWGGGNDANLDVCGIAEGIEVRNFLTEEARKRGLDSCDNLTRLSGMGAQVCYAARPHHFVIGAHGKIMKCTVALDKKDYNIVGEMDSCGMRLDYDKISRWTEPAFESDERCKKCVVLPVCQGIACPLARVDKGEHPCPPIRTNMKVDLRAAHRSKIGGILR